MCRIHTVPKSPDNFSTLSSYLAYLRKVREYTLQDVSDLVEEAVTCSVLPDRCSLTPGYLSSLEAGKFDEPSPHKLRALAYVYHIPCPLLMEKAGYLPSNDQKERISPLLSSDVPELTAKEREFLREYFDFVRYKRMSHCDCHKRQE